MRRTAGKLSFDIINDTITVDKSAVVAFIAQSARLAQRVIFAWVIHK